MEDHTGNNPCGGNWPRKYKRGRCSWCGKWVGVRLGYWWHIIMEDCEYDN